CGSREEAAFFGMPPFFSSSLVFAVQENLRAPHGEVEAVGAVAFAGGDGSVFHLQRVSENFRAQARAYRRNDSYKPSSCLFRIHCLRSGGGRRSAAYRRTVHTNSWLTSRWGNGD